MLFNYIYCVCSSFVFSLCFYHIVLLWISLYLWTLLPGLNELSKVLEEYIKFSFMSIAPDKCNKVM
jgi:hypothetical protein